MESVNQNFELEKKRIKIDESPERTSYCSLSRPSTVTVTSNMVMTSTTSLNVLSRTSINHKEPLSGTSGGNGSTNHIDLDDVIYGDEEEEDLTPTEGDDLKKLKIMHRERSGGGHSSAPLKSSKHKRHKPNHKIGEKLKEELTKYKLELKEYNETTKDLEEKYLKINYELNEMQQKHDHFVANRSRASKDSDAYYESTTSVASEVSINKHTHFSRNSSFLTVLAGKHAGAPSSNDDLRDEECIKKYRKLNAPGASGVNVDYDKVKRRTKRKSNEQENTPPPHNSGGGGGGGGGGGSGSGSNNSALNDVYNVLKDVINTTHQKSKLGKDDIELNQLYSTISSLKSEQMQYRFIIRQQQDCINDYHSRCVKAQEIMKTQKQEIDKLHINNKQLESSIYHDIDDLRAKIDVKLKTVSHLPQLMRDEHSKYEKAVRENCLLAEKLHLLQAEAGQLKVKIDDLGRRKLMTINRLKAAERDLKIFKNYNTALKNEKRRLGDDLSKVKEQLESLQSTGKRQLARHRDQSEKQRRELQKRIFDLELKLSRSQNSTTSLIQERDSLIAELQTQLHTLVHNFEVSQKHIRVLRRHIYSMTASGGGGSGNTPNAGGVVAGNMGATGIGQACSGSSASRINAPRLVKTKA